MMLLPILVCLFALLQASLASPIATSKRKTVDLSYSCMRVTGKDAKKDDIPVILLHGLGLSKESWMGIYQLLALKTGKRVCIADLRNHGDSPWSNETDIDAMAEDINRLMDKLKAPKAIVLGHSLGGKVAIHFTLNHPTKVDKLIVEDMRPNGLTPQALLEIRFFLTLIAKATSVMPEGTSEKEAKAAVLKFINDQLIKVNSSELLDSRAVAFLPIKCSEGKCRWKTNTQLISEVVKNPLALLTKSSGQFDGSTLFVYGTVSPFKIYEDESSIKKLFQMQSLLE